MSTAALNAALAAETSDEVMRVSLDGPAVDVEAPAVDADQVAGGGLAARLQSRLREIERATTMEFPVPGWGEVMRFRMRMLGAREIAALGKNPRADEVVAAAVDLVVIDADDGQTTVDLDGLATLMGIAGAAGSVVVTHVCGGDQPRVNALLAAWWGWRMGEVPVVEETLGE